MENTKKIETVSTFKTVLPAWQILRIEEQPDGTNIVIQRKVYTDDFLLVDAENLSLEDEFMQINPPMNDLIRIDVLVEKFKSNDFLHKDELMEIEELLGNLQKKDVEEMSGYIQTKKILQAKALITEAIKYGVRNFYKSKNDSSFIPSDKKIYFAKGQMPAVAKPYEWWSRIAKNYAPEHNSRIGTRLEYGAFLGVLIKSLVAEGYSVEDAWSSVCGDSRDLGHYINSVSDSYRFELTGSRVICGFADLANIRKILVDDFNPNCLWLASGSYKDNSFEYPISELVCYGEYECGEDFQSTPWIVLS